MSQLRGTDLLEALARVAFASYPETHQRWVDLSYRWGRSDFFLVKDLQQVGKLDLVLRRLEDDLAPIVRSQDNAELERLMFSQDFAQSLSVSWLLSAYEVVRLHRDRAKEGAGIEPALDRLFNRLSLVRIPVVKAEVAFTNRGRQKGTPHRPTNMINLDTGSAVWAVVDPKANHYVEIGRRDLADELLALSNENGRDTNATQSNIL